MNNDITLTQPQRQRIHVVGTSGSGKTTLADELARRMNVPHIELDRLHWLPDWTEESDERYREKLRAAIAAPKWIIDGNYFSKSADIQWAEQGGATAVIWCDLPFPITFCRAVNRAFRRAWTKNEIWPGTGNRESFRRSFLSHDSIILWTIVSYRRNQARYSEIIIENRFPHIRFVRLRSQQQCDEFLKQF